MRTKSSLKNTFASMLSNIVTILIGFISQAVFIKILGTEYLGINGLFSNIISMLGIVELGIGSAIIYNLYKPIEKKEIETVKSLMSFYKKAYNIIALVVFILGTSLIPFLGFFIEKVTVDINIQLVYFLFIIDIVCSYLLSYKRSILYADQKNYIINIIHILYLIILNTSQLIILYLTKNYYLYLIIKIIMRILENIVISIIVNNKYSYLKEKNIAKLNPKIEKDIFKKVKALFCHKIGAFIILGTDNIIISKFLGLNVVGLYSNYYMIINSVQTLFSQAITALTPSVGNMLVTESKEKVYDVFKKIRFINFWIATLTSTAILLLMEPFIKIWIGSNYLLETAVLYVLVLNFYQVMMRSSYMTFKEAAGIFHEDRYVPLIESSLNIIFSCILVKVFSLAGVFMGTIISGLALWCHSYPKYVYKKLFARNYINYAKETLAYIFLFLLIAVTSYSISTILIVNSNLLKLIINALVVLIIPNLIMLIVFKKTDNFNYFKDLLLKITRKIIK